MAGRGTVRERAEAMAITQQVREHLVRDIVYEAIKANRGVPDTRVGVAAGILTPKETALLDDISERLRSII